MNTMHVKKGDTVVVLSGVEKGKSGKIIEAYPKLGLVLVEGVGMKKKHQRARRERQKGQIIDKHMPIQASKVAPTSRKASKGKQKKK